MAGTSVIGLLQTDFVLAWLERGLEVFIRSLGLREPRLSRGRGRRFLELLGCSIVRGRVMTVSLLAGCLVLLPRGLLLTRVTMAGTSVIGLLQTDFVLAWLERGLEVFIRSLGLREPRLSRGRGRRFLELLELAVVQGRRCRKRRRALERPALVGVLQTGLVRACVQQRVVLEVVVVLAVLAGLAAAVPLLLPQAADPLPRLHAAVG